MSDLNVRIKSKHDTTVNWNNAIGFIPMNGEIIIYDDYSTITVEENGQNVTKNIPGIKIGTGNAYVQDLPFISDDIRTNLAAHLDDDTRHLIDGERTFWNNKVNIDDTYDILESELDNETLIFNRN